MKAEERHQLEQNDLAKAIGLVKSVNRRRIAVWAGVAVLVFGAIFTLRYLNRKTLGNEADYWIRLQSSTDKASLEKLMKDLRGKPQGAAAKMKYARILLAADGLDKMATTDRKARLAAADSVEEAKKLFLELTSELGDNLMLQQEAWLDAAKAEESLIAVPKSESDEASRGNFDKSVEYLEKAAKLTPDTDAGKRIGEQIEAAKKDRKKRMDFYKDLQATLFVKSIPEMDDGPSIKPKAETPKADAPKPEAPKDGKSLPPPESKGPELKAPEAPKSDAKPKEQPAELKAPEAPKPDAKPKEQPGELKVPVPPVPAAPTKEAGKKEPEKK